MKVQRFPSKRMLFRSVLCGFLLASVASWFPFAASCGSLSEDVVRLHVVADSDDPEAQAVKLKVRDAVLDEAAKWCGSAGSMEEASGALCLHLESIRTAADKALRDNGFSETARVQVSDLYFPTRDYESFSLPAGKYRTLRVTIGAGKGKNWWCMVFPGLCLPAAEEKGEDPLAFLTEAEREVVEHPQKYKVQFKAAEWYQELCKWFGK